jgi:hypothetical protein
MKIVKLIKTGYENNYIYLLLLLSTVIYGQTGQSGGIGYQAVIYKSNIQTTPGVPIATTPLANASICMRFTFSNGQDEYIENREITTDEFGMVNLKIGLVDSPVLGTFAGIDWSDGDKTLVVDLDQSGTCIDFEEISNQLFASPFAFNAVTANNVTGVVAIKMGYRRY